MKRSTDNGKIFYAHTSIFPPVKMGLVPPATIALVRVGDKFHYGVALCSKGDNFSRKHGRKIAETRLEEGFGVMDVPEPILHMNYTDSCVEQIRNLSFSALSHFRKWKRKVTRFNKEKLATGKVVRLNSIPPTA